MAKTKQEFLARIREVAARELDALPDTLKAMNPDKRAAVALKLLSLTLESKDIYSDDNGGIWGYLNLPPSSVEQDAAAC